MCQSHEVLILRCKPHTHLFFELLRRRRCAQGPSSEPAGADDLSLFDYRPIESPGILKEISWMNCFVAAPCR